MAKIDYSNIIENDFEREFYEQIHDKILSYLQKKGNSSLWEIVRKIGGSDRRVLRLLNQMLFAKEITLENSVISIQNKVLNILDVDFKAIKREMKDIYSQKPGPTFLFDQRPVTMQTTLNRAFYLNSREDLENKRIAVIGDDDLTSLSVGLIRKAKEVVVFDIDERLVNFINKISREKKLNVKAYKYDLTKKIPSEFSDNFDIFLTDPTPNLEAFSLFISIGLNLLKKGKGLVGYVSYFPSHQEINIDFQKFLTEKKVIMTDIIPEFTEYEFIRETYREEDLVLLEKFDSGEEKLSFTENMTRFETTNETNKQIDKVDPNKIMGKATKRVLSNLEKDPAYIRGDKEFVSSIARLMQGRKDE